MNASMVNGHTKGELGAAGHHNHNGIADITDEESLDQKPETSAVGTTGARGTDTRSRDHQLSNGCAGTSSRDQSHAHVSLPPGAANGRETTDGRGAFSMVDSSRTPSKRHENENRSGSGNYTGKGKRGKAGKQKKPKEEEKRKNNLVQMAESMAESLQSLNARIEEQQRQQQLCNGHGASANGVSTNEKSSSRKEDGHK